MDSSFYSYALNLGEIISDNQSCSLCDKYILSLTSSSESMIIISKGHSIFKFPVSTANEIVGK